MTIELMHLNGLRSPQTVLFVYVYKGLQWNRGSESHPLNTLNLRNPCNPRIGCHQLLQDWVILGGF